MDEGSDIKAGDRVNPVLLSAVEKASVQGYVPEEFFSPPTRVPSHPCLRTDAPPCMRAEDIPRCLGCVATVF